MSISRGGSGSVRELEDPCGENRSAPFYMLLVSFSRFSEPDPLVRRSHMRVLAASAAALPRGHLVDPAASLSSCFFPFSIWHVIFDVVVVVRIGSIPHRHEQIHCVHIYVLLLCEFL